MIELKVRKCPKCGFYYGGVPAISRTDNKTLICQNCGIREALESIGVVEEKDKEHILDLIYRYIRERGMKK